MPLIILKIIISYVIGSIPTAYIFGRILKGIDIRKFGSGNVGATNALRVLGKWPGAIVLVLDTLKGFFTVVFLGDFLASQAGYIPDETLRLILGLSCICGHNWTIFLRFKGGKGMATTLGVLLALAVKVRGLEVILALSILTWLLIFIIARVVSLASVLTGLTLPIYMALFRQSYVMILTGIILGVFIILRHQSNLKRIFQGKEPRLF
ncbi:MAG: glycerol-3-phosphate 1-O-acyltransferase PlsY [Candidatus Omnitrophica bacterium]|nr:glycerol-3-phosphate 1-O-acyltransferase PlsY [Candidatus Omnitrophota bacterium]MCG2706898.1 glycerol-3-phosphate 1-O-acyltransferase PlsY [Candidatus Omnitrophota bacterium]